MENQHHSHHDQTKVLSMNISCCEECPKLLEKKLLKMHGVSIVTIDTEKDLVLVTGPIDAMTLLNNVAKLGKSVQLLPSGKQHSSRRTERYCPSSSYHEGDGKSAGRRQRSGPHPDERKEEKSKEEHKCEAYEPPGIDPRVCRDLYCKVHPRSRPIVDKNPADGSPFFFGGMPFHGGFGSSYMHPMWYGEEPPPPPQFGYHGRPPPPQYGYQRPPRNVLPRPFGF